MSTDPTGDGRNAEVVTLRPAPDTPAPGSASGEPGPAAPTQVTYGVTAEPGAMRPVIPEHLQSLDGIRAALGLHFARRWHRTRYHGLRSPAYLLKSAGYAIMGALLVIRRVLTWWHWTDGWMLESLAVAAGRAGHADAMRAHTEGKKTRAQRGKILGVCVILIAAAVAAVLVFAPWWSWLALGIVLLPVLARHGRPADKRIVQAAVVPPKYEPPSPAIITRALASLGIAGINQSVKDGPGITFVSDIHRDGPGWCTQLDLPHGVTASMILARREQLASGLRRPLSATWPGGVPAEHAGRLELWIGFHDISKSRPATWPLLRAGQTDVFAPFPFGTDPRGKRVDAPLFEHNWLIGASPGQGKTAAVRVVACAAALDPLAEVWIHELAGKGDLEPLAKIAHRYTSGLDDEAIAYAAESMKMLRRELDARSLAMKKIPKESRPDGKVTRAMAGNRRARLFPLVAVFDEVQNLFMHPGHGEQAAADAAYVIRLGRAYGVILVLATQRPDKDSLPTTVSGNVSTRFCLKVPGQVENDMILGTSAYKNGYNAAVFRPKTDAGLGWLRAEGDPQVCRTYYLDLTAAERIADRARVLRGQAGTLTGYALGEDTGELPRSFAADVVTVFADSAALSCATIAVRLAERIPEGYADITQEAAASQLRALGVPVKNVREDGSVRKGCDRVAVETAAGGVPGA